MIGKRTVLSTISSLYPVNHVIQLLNNWGLIFRKEIFYCHLTDQHKTFKHHENLTVIICIKNIFFCSFLSDPNENKYLLFV